MDQWIDTSFIQKCQLKKTKSYLKVDSNHFFFFCQLEMKQRYLAGKMNGPDEKGDGHHEEVTMETLGKKCKAKSLFF